MTKGDSADRLFKRLQKVERAQTRLGDITTRIGVQSETLAELLKVARGFVNEMAMPRPAVRTGSTAPARKPATANRPAAQHTMASVSRPSTSRPVTVGQTSAERRAPGKAASA